MIEPRVVGRDFGIDPRVGRRCAPRSKAGDARECPRSAYLNRERTTAVTLTRVCREPGIGRTEHVCGNNRSAVGEIAVGVSDHGNRGLAQPGGPTRIPKGRGAPARYEGGRAGRNCGVGQGQRLDGVRTKSYRARELNEGDIVILRVVIVVGVNNDAARRDGSTHPRYGQSVVPNQNLELSGSQSWVNAVRGGGHPVRRNQRAAAKKTLVLTRVSRVDEGDLPRGIGDGGRCAADNF